MWVDDMSERTTALVTRWVLKRYREAHGRNGHLRDCSDAVATDVEGGDGTYGCDTGCEYVRLEATISCPHGERDEYDYGDFGELAWILEDLEAEAEPEGKAT